MSTLLWVASGVFLAAAIASVIVIVYPEDRAGLGLRASEEIRYEILPTSAKLADLERGRSYYVQLCLSCHGMKGRGDGEYSYRMVPKPGNLTSQEIMGKSTGQISAIIGNGITGTAMRGWKEELNETQRGQVIEYIRYLALLNQAS